MLKNKDRNTSAFDIDGVPPVAKALPLSLQHILAMIVGTVTVPIVIAGVTGASPHEKTLLIQAALIVAGLATLLQLYPIGKLGSRLPIIFGVGFTYVPTLTSIGAEYGLSGIFGAQLIAGIFTIFLGIFIKRFIKYFPPLVTGTVVTTIGLSLYPIAVNYMAGGINAPDYGSPTNWGLALLTLSIVIVCGQFAKGYLKSAAMIVGIGAGYIVALVANLVDFTNVSQSAWLSIPKISNFSMSFHVPAIVSMLVLCLVNALQSIGDLSATTMGGMNRQITDEELSRGIVGSGVVTVAGSFFGGLPPSSYSQNVGLLAMNKVISRFVLGIAAVFMLLAGFVPKFGALMTTIPTSVLGGATVSIFGMITMTGFRLITQEELSSRNITIVGLALALGMGVTTVPQCLEQFPPMVSMVFGKSPIVIATLVAFTLNMILPNKSLRDEEKERLEMSVE